MPCLLKKLAPSHGLTLGAASLMWIAASCSSEAAPATNSFLAHQAVYDLSLNKARRTPSLDSARGRILYIFTGSSCEGYTTDFRQVSELDMGEGRTAVSDLRSTSWEDGDGKSYRFKIESFMDSRSTNKVDGIAERDSDGVTVSLVHPAKKTLKLNADVVFPTQQVQRILAAARQGKSLLQLSVYDGSDTGEKIYNTLTVIGQPIANKAPEKPDATAEQAALNGRTRWPVTVSYYDGSSDSKTGEQTPVYSMSFELFDNGVSRALVLDYNDFVIGGTMSKFEARETKPCG